MKEACEYTFYVGNNWLSDVQPRLNMTVWLSLCYMLHWDEAITGIPILHSNIVRKKCSKCHFLLDVNFLISIGASFLFEWLVTSNLL